MDLLDEANLADNAFLFIGQGMVDQALALRPEERRPLFEEAAGIRKHDRRRRAAEAELARGRGEPRAGAGPAGRAPSPGAAARGTGRAAGASGAPRAELSPRRWWTVARVRLAGLARQSREQRAALAVARQSGETALAQLRETEARVVTLSAAIADRAVAEGTARAAFETARARVVELQVARTRLDAEVDALAGALQRIRDELAAIEQRTRESGATWPARCPSSIRQRPRGWTSVERRLAQARRELAELHDAGRAEAERTRSAREAREAAEADRERATWRERDAARRARGARSPARGRG